MMSDVSLTSYLNLDQPKLWSFNNKNRWVYEQ